MLYFKKMTTVSEKYLQTVINNVASELHLKEWSFTKQSFDNVAQNYFGVLIPINLIGKVCESYINIPIVLKLAPMDERFRVSGAITIMFAREIFIYSKLLCKYQDLQNTLPVINQFIIPKCYYICKEYCHEVIAMENMCDKGYKPFVDSMFLDLNHINIALKSLARLHSLSFILKEKDIKLLEEAKDICVPLTENSNTRYIQILLDRLKKALKMFQNTCYVPLIEKLEHNCVNLIESTAYSVKNVCLCHGDIWKENILFQYENNIPQSACIIDYQTTRVSSPAYDLLYLIVSSTSASLRKIHFNQFLDTYYQTLEETLLLCDVEPKKVYSKDMLFYDLKIVGPACLIVANTAIWLSSGLQQEGHVRSKIVLKTEEEKEQAENKYRETVSGIIDDLSSYGYLLL